MTTETTREITNSDDIIDSRDVVARIAYLQSEYELGGILDEECDELNALRALAEEGENATSDWPHGAALIRDSYFERYAEELADDIGAIDRNANWPINCIDWEEAARELRSDYTSVDFDGVTYWTR